MSKEECWVFIFKAAVKWSSFAENSPQQVLDLIALNSMEEQGSGGKWNVEEMGIWIQVVKVSHHEQKKNMWLLFDWSTCRDSSVGGIYLNEDIFNFCFLEQDLPVLL